MSNVTCFFIERARLRRRSLRRYSHSDGCSLGKSYHNAMFFLENVPDVRNENDCIVEKMDVDRSDPRWPRQCACGYVFSDADHWQVFEDPIYRRADNGQQMTLDEAPLGAMYDADWYPKDWRGPDGRALIVVCPDGHPWHIDGRASNCTKPNDKDHRCWVRHGNPPLITVDKDGNTCSAGAGSILTPKYHGFLRNGVFVSC